MKKIVVITGSTGVGKTKLSIALSKRFNGEIINADASQFYLGLDIGTSKITPIEMDSVKHHLISFLKPNESFSIKDFQNEGRSLLASIERPFIVGGSGLYINALIMDYQLNATKRQIFEEDALDSHVLYDQLVQLDPIAAQKTHPNNRRRVIRYLELALQQGQVEVTPPIPLYDALILCFTRPRDILYQRINHRTEEMFQSGWIEECRQLENAGFDLTQIKEIGYKDIHQYLHGFIALEEVKNQIRQQTRRYAKRQMTWYRNQMNCQFIDLETETVDQISDRIDLFFKATSPR